MAGGLTLKFISYAGAAIIFLFSTLSLACGLYYLAELVEEYTVQTKRVIKGLTLAVVVLHLSLWLLDGMPFSKIMFSLGCHAIYSLNLANFPYINLLSFPFLTSCVLVLADHFMWFQHFAKHYYSFMSIAGFFGICVWMIPFAYFISLSANDNALPSFDKTQQSKQKKSGILKSIFDTLLNKKESTPVLIETPKYAGFGSESLGSRPGTPLGMGGSASGPSTPYGSFNPDKTMINNNNNNNRTDYAVSRPSSSNSNYRGYHSQAGSGFGATPVQSSSSSSGYQPQQQQQPQQPQQPQQQQQQQQQYASSSAVYSSQSNNSVGSRF